MGDCASIDDCIIMKQQAVALNKMETLAQGTHDSTTRQEEIVKNLANTIAKVDRENREDHRDIFNRLGAVDKTASGKLSAKDVAPWVMAILSMAMLFYTMYGTKPSQEVRYVRPEHYNGSLERGATARENRFSLSTGSPVLGESYRMPETDSRREGNIGSEGESGWPTNRDVLLGSGH